MLIILGMSTQNGQYTGPVFFIDGYPNLVEILFEYLLSHKIVYEYSFSPRYFAIFFIEIKVLF